MSQEDLELFRNKTAELLSSENPASKLFGSILNDAIDHIDSQAAQIEALKEKLVEERSIRLFRADSKDIFSMWTLQSKEIQDEYKRDARQQLRADPDLAGVEWE